jgi:hypothetical protein
MYNTTTPPKITRAIGRLCTKVNITEKPYYVTVRPGPNCQKNECFWNVKRKVEQSGGKMQHGWTIWEWPQIMVEAEFHAIWISPDETAVDITPKDNNIQRILFLPDNSREYDFANDGARVSNVREPLSAHPLVAEFIAISQELFDFEEMHSIGREIHLEGRAIRTHEDLFRRKAELQLEILRVLSPSRRHPGRNDLCPCGSGNKYKKCCGVSSTP